MQTPDDIIAELRRVQLELSKAPEAIFNAEIKLADCEAHLDSVEQTAFLSAEGSVAERSAKARLKAIQARLERDVAKAEVNRIRQKIRSLESASVAVSTMGKQLELTWKHG